MGESGEEMRRHCVVMDEVDGMSGNEDRGGMQVGGWVFGWVGFVVYW